MRFLPTIYCAPLTGLRIKPDFEIKKLRGARPSIPSTSAPLISSYLILSFYSTYSVVKFAIFAANLLDAITGLRMRQIFKTKRSGVFIMTSASALPVFIHYLSLLTRDLHMYHRLSVLLRSLQKLRKREPVFTSRLYRFLSILLKCCLILP